MPDNLVLQGSTWHVKLAIPLDVRPSFGHRSYLSKSLETGSRSVAMERRLAILTKWKSEIRQARTIRSQRPDWREEIFTLAESTTQMIRNAAPVYDPASIPTNEVEARQGFKEGTQAIQRGFKGIASLLLADGAEQSDLESLKNLFLNAMHSDEEANRFTVKLTKLIESVQLKRKVETLGLSKSEIEESQQILSGRYTPQTSITPSRIEAFSNHLEKMLTNEKSRKKPIAHLKAFNTFLVENKLEIDFHTVNQFLNTLITTKTKRQYLWGLGKFWSWAMKHDKAFKDRYQNIANPFKDHDLPKNDETATKSYLPYTKEQVENLYRAALAQNDNEVASLIKIGAFTGARAEEIGAIHRDNVTIENGIPTWFNIPVSKSKAGIRDVPIHTKLQPLISDLLAKSSDGYLLKHGKNKAYAISHICKRFGHLKTGLDFSRRHTFHSFRGTANRMMLNAGVKPIFTPYLLGHDIGAGVNLDVYYAGPTNEQKIESIMTLDFDI